MLRTNAVLYKLLPIGWAFSLTIGFLGCEPPPAETAPQGGESFAVIESFERPGFWSVGGDRAEMTHQAAGVTHGARALRLTTPSARPGTQLPLAGELPLNLSRASRIRVDVTAHRGAPVDLELHARSRSGAYFILGRHRVEAGGPHAVTFDLSGPVTMAQGGDAARAWTRQRDKVTTLFLNVFATDRGPLDVSLDALRADAPIETLLLEQAPDIVRVEPSTDALQQFETFELTLTVDGRTRNPFDRNGGLAIDGVFYGPEGQRVTVPAFLREVAFDGALPAPGDGDDTTRARNFRAGDGIWSVRFTPTEPGRWEYEVVARSGRRTAVSDRGAFRCAVAHKHPGFVRVSSRDRRYFETDRGDVYRPVGQNVAWADNYEYYLDKIQAYGGNWVRVWMCPWNLQLEPKHTPGWYDLDVARRLDGIVRAAEARNIRIQLVLLWHDEFASSFARSPFDVDNGGPLRSPEGFFYMTAAKKRFKRRLDYIVARWGHSPAIMAWELFNEVDLTRYRHTDDVIAWHREMAAYLKRIDPTGRLVTTSLSTGGQYGRLPERLWTLGDIDFTQAHLYDPDIHDEARSAAARHRRYGKPFFVAEFGRGYQARDDQADPIGATLHAGLWQTAVSRDAGLAMSWWWDTYIDPRNLYDHFEHVAAFVKDMDLRDASRREVELTLFPGGGPSVTVIGSAGRTAADLWVYAPDHVALPREGRGPILEDPTAFRLNGLVDGEYEIAFYDPYTGTWSETETEDVLGGTLRVTIPATDKDKAIRIRAVKPPEVRLEDEGAGWGGEFAH